MKTIYTLNLGNSYAPTITQMTRPLLNRYAKKIGAETVTLTERKFPDWPPTYEKLQIFAEEHERKSDWIFYIDADAMVHPDFFDPTNHLRPDTVLHNANDMAGTRWRYDQYFRRDGRHIGSCNWFAVAPKDCLDLWRPLDISYEEAVKNIFPVQAERVTGFTDASHLIDDYALSSNIARFGLKYQSLADIQKNLNAGSGWLWHLYNMGQETKARMMYELLTYPPPPAGAMHTQFGWGLMEKDYGVLGELIMVERNLPPQGENPLTQS